MNGIKVTLLLISSLTIMAASIVAPSLPAISDEYANIGSSELLAKLVLSLPALFIAISAPLAGKMVDRFGRMRLLYMGLFMYVVGGATVYFIQDIYAILVFRALLGIAIGVITTVTITLIGDYFEGDVRKKFVGLQASFVGIAGIAFLLLGGALADIGWRVPFLIYFAALLLVPLAVVHLRETHVNEGQPLSKFRSGNLLRIIFTTSFVMMLLFFVIPTQLPFLLAFNGHSSSSLAGVALAVNACGMMCTAIAFPRFVAWMSHAHIYAVGFVLLGAGIYVAAASQAYILITLGMLIAGMGIGMTWPNSNLWALELSNFEARGRAMGILTTCFFLGQFISPLAVEPVLQNSDLPGLFQLVAAAMVTVGLAFALANNRLGRMQRSD